MTSAAGTTSANDEPLLIAEGLTKRYGRQLACRDVSFELYEGEVIATACAASVCFHAGLNSTTAAPSRQIALTATTHSGRLELISATRSPGRTPRLDSSAASPPT